MLGAALKVFEDEGYDQVYTWCRALEPGEVDDEEEDDGTTAPLIMRPFQFSLVLYRRPNFPSINSCCYHYSGYLFSGDSLTRK